MNLRNLLKKQWENKTLLRVIAVVSLLGFIDATYLTADHYLGTGVKCVLLEGCDIVLISEYSVIFGVPLALLGMIFYAAVFALVNLLDIYNNRMFTKLLAGAGLTGFLASLAFVYLQVFVIKALCIYCLVSAASSTIIFILSALLYKRTTDSGHWFVT